MESKDLNPAREEYFEQLISKATMWIGAFNGQREANTNKYKEEILGITYDSKVALQKRVEELEAGLTDIQKRFATKAGYITGGLYEIIENLLPPNE